MGPKTSKNADIMSIMTKVSDKAMYFSHKGKINFVINSDGNVNSWWYDMAKKEITSNNIFKPRNLMPYLVGIAIAVLAALIFIVYRRRKSLNK